VKPIRILLVEDDSALLRALEESYHRIFASRNYDAKIEQAVTVDQARKLAKAASSNPYDFVSLDVNLGDTVLTGLDVLETLKRFHSAWMVALLTGVEADDTVDETMGRARAETLRKQLRRDAYAHFPAERLLVVEKPSSRIPVEEAERLLTNRLEQIALVYEEVGRLRYVFRPIEVASLERVPAPKGVKAKRRFVETSTLHWQIRFNCGEIRTLSHIAGLRTLHYLLSRDADQSVTPEEALANDPKTDKAKSEASSAGADPVAEYFEAQGIGWKDLTPADQQKLMRAALSLKFERYRELRGFQDEDDLSPAEEDELSRIVKELGPLSDSAEMAYQRMKPDDGPSAVADEIDSAVLSQSGLHASCGNYDRLGTGRRGEDSPAAQLFRARMKRVKDYLRENGFADFAQHIENYVQSTGANWSYNPPGGVEWTT
jgi:ActR/RegA family two-component response regulator